MVQIKLSIAFVLAAAAIAPVIARPHPAGNRPNPEPRNGPNIHPPELRNLVFPDSPPSSPHSSHHPPPPPPPANAPHSRREYAEEFKVREFVNMFKRDFEDLEFDARYFDDKFYLD